MKLIEFFIPSLTNFLSSSSLSVCGWAGGVIGYITSLPLIPVLYLLGKTAELYEGLRNKTREAVALVYAKTNIWVLSSLSSSGRVIIGSANYPQDNYEYDPLFARLSQQTIDQEIHSPAFREQIEILRHSTWSRLIFGVFASDHNNTTQSSPAIESTDDTCAHYPEAQAVPVNPPTHEEGSNFCVR